MSFFEAGLLSAIQDEASGRLTREMACFLFATSPSAIGRAALHLSRMGLIHRDGKGTMYLDQPRPTNR